MKTTDKNKLSLLSKRSLYQRTRISMIPTTRYSVKVKTGETTGRYV